MAMSKPRNSVSSAFIALSFIRIFPSVCLVCTAKPSCLSAEVSTQNSIHYQGGKTKTLTFL